MITDMMLCKFPNNTFGCNITELVSSYCRDTCIKCSNKAYMIISECDETNIIFNVIMDDKSYGSVSCEKHSDGWFITNISISIDYDLSHYIGFKLVFAESWLEDYKK